MPDNHRPALTCASWLPILMLSRGVHPLEIADDDRFLGLEPLASVIAEADVVGIGESIHLSGGLERARVRVGRHLIEAHGFNTVAIEVSWVEGREADRRLQACSNGETDAVEVPFDDPLWEGMVPLLSWLCQHHRQQPDASRVHVIGIDIQDVWSHRKLLDPAWEDEALGACHGANVRSARELRRWGIENGFPPPTAESRDRCLERITARLSETTDATQRLALRSMQVNEWRTWALLAEEDVGAAYNHREAAMHQVFEEERDRVSGARTVLFAHDSHVGHFADIYQPIGQRISDSTLGYAAISVTGYVVETRFGEAHDPEVPHRGPLHRLHRLGHDTLLVDRVRRRSAHDAVLFVDHATREL